MFAAEVIPINITALTRESVSCLYKQALCRIDGIGRPYHQLAECLIRFLQGVPAECAQLNDACPSAPHLHICVIAQHFLDPQSIHKAEP